MSKPAKKHRTTIKPLENTEAKAPRALDTEALRLATGGLMGAACSSTFCNDVDCDRAF
jgi:hypothetical protein